MAGRYKNLTQPNGQPVDEFFGQGTPLESGNDNAEIIREMYGMIWWLAMMLCQQHTGRKVPHRDAVLACIQLAQNNVAEGLTRGESGN
jgi:hypothetical protein